MCINNILIHHFLFDRDSISAELPDPIQDPVLYNIILKQMVHGPCGVLNHNLPCMKDGHYTKSYPRKLLTETKTGQDGYPLYRMRSPDDIGFVAMVTMRNGQEVEVDNRWIVLYYPLLPRTFNAHINVEFCHSVKSIKYICAYINKGPNAAMISLIDEITNDEITKYQMGSAAMSHSGEFLAFPYISDI